MTSTSYTKPALVHHGDWDADSDAHPAAKWMHEYTDLFDKGDFKTWPDYQTSDFTYAKANGQIFPPGQASWDQVKSDYSLFTKYHHEPYFAVVYEREQGDGWELLGNAWLFANLPGQGEGSKVKDVKGREWDIKVPAGFHFVYMKDSEAKHDGIKLATTSVTSDSGPIVVELLKRGVMKPADLGL